MNSQAAQFNKNVRWVKMMNHINKHRKNNKNQNLYKKELKLEEEKIISATFAREQAKNSK